MLTINEKFNGKEGTMVLTGKIDMMTAVELDDALRTVLPKVNSLTLDCSRLAYVSSAGLRVLLSASKNLSERGGMVLSGLTPPVRQILDVTGMTDLFTIR